MELLVKRIYVALVVFLIVALVSCGEKMKLPTEVPPPGTIGDTLYLLINPPWDAEHGFNFSGVTSLCFGRDTYLYIADTGNNRIFQLDAAGTIHDEFQIDNPISISQDEYMRLLVVTGEKRIYKIDVGPGGDRVARVAFDYDVAPADVPPSDTGGYFFKLHSMVDSTDRFMSITDLPFFDKSYFVAVSSDRMNNGRVLWFWGATQGGEFTDSLFDSKYSNADADTFRNPVVVTGNGITTTTFPNSIYTYLDGSAMHLIVCQDSGSYPVHDMRFERQVWDRHWVFNYTHNPGETDLLTRGFFDGPRGATVDPLGNIYVVESGISGQCGAYKFSKRGELLETFCDADSGLSIFDSPSGITYDIYGDRRTVYISDTGNNRILRFKLSTDLEP